MSSNPYLDVLDQSEQRDVSGFRAAATLATENNPDEVARQRRIAELTGRPLAAVQALPDDAERAAKMRELETNTANAPVLRQKFSDADFAALAHDDTQSLSAGERALGDWGIAQDRANPVTIARGLYSSFASSWEKARQGSRAMFADLIGNENMRKDATRRFAAADFADEIKQPAIQSTAGRWVYGGASSALQMIPAITASVVTKNPSVGLAVIGGQMEPETYGKYRERGGTVGQSLLGSGLETGAEILTEKIPMGFLTDRLGKVGAGEFLKGWLGRELPTELAANISQDAIDTSIANPDKTWGEFVKNLPDTVGQTAVATLMLGGGLGVVNHVATRMQAEENKAIQAEQAHAALQQLQGVAQQSKLAERAPDVLASFMQEVADTHGAGEVQIEARVFNQALEAANIDPQSVLAKLPDEVQKSYAQAVETGGDVVIPTGEAVAKLLSSEEGNALVPHLRFGPDDMSFAEREEFRAKQAEQFKEEASKALEEHADDQAWQASSQKVEDYIHSQLVDAGVPDQEARAQAALHREFASVMASRLGIAPDQWYAVNKPTIERSDTSASPKSFLQRIADTVRAAGQRTFKTDKETGLPRQVTNTEDVQSAITPILRGSRNMPPVLVLQSPKQLRDGDDRQRAVWNWIKSRNGEEDVAGVMHGGQMYLFGDNIRSPEQAREVLLHEGAHYGLRGLMDEQTLGALMGQIRESNADISEDSERYAIQYETSLTEATEEVLAAWAQKNEMANLKGFEKIAAIVREWLRKLGFVREWSDNDVRQLLSRAQEFYKNPPSNEYANIVRKGDRAFRASRVDNYDGQDYNEGHGQVHDRSSGRTSQDDAATVAGTSAERGWADATRAKRSDGKPARLFRGAGRFLSAEDFGKEALGVASGNPSSGLGVWFSFDEREASNYGDVEDFHLDIRNPFHVYIEDLPGFSSVEEAFAWREKLRSQGYDGIYIDARHLGGPLNVVAFDAKQAIYPNPEAKTYYQEGQNSQQVRGYFSPETYTITLTPRANLSTFLHESGHYFLESFLGASNGSLATPELQADAQKLFDWFGIRDQSEWDSLSHEEKTTYHEQFAEGFEKYLLKGRAPSIQLQGVFRTFARWLKYVYSKLRGNDAPLSDEVRGVMDRMLATEEDIKAAEYARSMLPLFDLPQQAGMDAEQLKALHIAQDDATQEAVEKLRARSVRDLKWLRGAQSKALKSLQAEASDLREQETMEARREVLSQPVYQVWQWLKGRIENGRESSLVAPRKSDPAVLDPTIDPMLMAIAKLGGIERESAVEQWGLKPEEKPQSGVFGKPVLRAKGKGYSIHEMAAKLSEHGYLGDVADVETLRDFEEKFFDALSGADSYSVQFEHQQDVRPGEADVLATDGVGRLDRASLREMYGATHPIIQHLEALRMVRKNGVHPDVLAELFGFASGDEMVRQLAVAQDPEAEARALADQRMLKKHGDLATPEAIQQAADEAIHNEARARFVSAELNALATVSRHQKIPAEAAKAYAEDMIARLKVRNIKPGQYAAAAARAGRAAEAAMRAGDTAKALAEKRNQLVQTYAARAAFEAKTEAKKIADKFRSIATGKDENIAKSRDMDVVNIIRAALDPFGFSGAKAEKAGRYLEVLAKRDEVMADVAHDVLTTIESIAKPLPDLTMGELRGLRDEIDRLWYLAQRNKRMEVDGNLLDLQEVAAQLHARMEQIGIPDTMPGDTSAVTPYEQAIMSLQSGVAALTRAESWVDKMDGTEEMGAFRRYVFTTIKEAADTYRTEKGKYLRQLRDTFAPIRDTMTKGLISAPEIGYTFGKDSGGVAMNEILHAILHTGNESNKRKLLLGRGWAQVHVDGSLDTSRWDSFVHRMIGEGRLTKVHFDFAQSVWDLLEQMKPAAQKAHRDAYGHYFDEITAAPFSVAFPGGEVVQYAGGYVPAKPDSRIVKDNELKKLIEEGKDGMAYAFPGTSKGFTKSRVEYNRPLMLDMRTLAQHIDQVLLFSSMEMPVRDVSRLIGMPQVSGALNRVDPAAINGMLIPWLNRAARQQVTTPVAGAGGLMRFLTTLRSRTGMALMFGNLSNAVQQVAGFAMAAVKVKPTSMLSAAAQFVAHPRQMAQHVAEASPFMAHRMDNQAEAMMGEVSAVLMNPTTYQSAQEFTKRHAYFLQSAIDNIMGPIIWTGAFNDAKEAGQTDADAVRLADASVRQTQGSTLPEDVSRFETGPAYARLFTQFIGYFNMQGNLVYTELAKAKEEGGKSGLARATSAVLLGFLTSAAVAEAIAQAFKGGPDDADKDGSYLDDWLLAVFGIGVVKNATALVPVAGSAAQMVINTWNKNPSDDKMSISPALNFVESIGHAPVAIYKALETGGSSQQAIRESAILLSTATGLPAYAAARPIGYLAGVSDGKIEPTGPVDSARGLVTGTASPR